MKKTFKYEKKLVVNEYGKQPRWEFQLIWRSNKIAVFESERYAIEVVKRCNAFVPKSRVVENGD